VTWFDLTGSAVAAIAAPSINIVRRRPGRTRDDRVDIVTAATDRLPRRQRDRRLDFFRGVAMFIILIAHIPVDWWALWIPARFGFSDGAEMFVFCSGMASALAFGGLFASHGFWVGAGRVASRIWQIYWAHIGLFLATLLLLIILNEVQNRMDYVAELNLGRFLENTGPNLLGLMTLTYIPNYFDMLPMYVAVLAMLPVVAMLGRTDPRLAGVFVVLVWLASTTGQVGLPAEPWSDREWFFNPFGWQLVFYTGFAFGMKWLKAPPIDRRWIIAAAAIALLSVPFSYYRILDAVPLLSEANAALAPLTAKSDYGALRYIHFLSLAYLGYCAVGEGGRRLFATGFAGRVIDVIRLVGQQSLAVFITSIVLAQFLGFVLDQMGRTPWTMLVVNLFGFACLVATARIVTWFKSEPWRKAPAASPTNLKQPDYAAHGATYARPAE
jgi:hypothetical protein